MYEIFQHPVVAIVFLIGVLVFVHEFGHFIAGKFFGFGVETFSIGFGPRALGFRRSGTDYRIGFIPLGGFVKFAGSMPSEPVPDRFKHQKMYEKPIWQRAIVIFAGPFANLLLAVAAYSYLGNIGINHSAPIVGQVRPGAVAEKAGIIPGDKIVGVNGRSINKWSKFVEVVSASGEKPIEVEWDRRGQIYKVSLVPELEEVEDINGNLKKVGRIGISYGFLPSIVAIGHDSLASKFGLATGMRVDSIKMLGTAYETRNYNTLLEILGKAFDSNASEVTFVVENAGRNDQFGISFGDNFAGMAVDPASSDYKKGLAVARLLGISDSSATISKLDAGAIDIPIKSGDVILGADDAEIKNFFDLQQFLLNNKKKQIEVSVLRDGQNLEFPLNLKPVEVQKVKGKDIYYAFPAQFMGSIIRPEPYVEKYDGLLASIGFGVRRSLELSGQIVGALIGLITRDVPLGALGGPILIAKVAGDSAALGFAAYLTTMALISINLCMINLFPIPVLDGGQLVMLLAEALKGGALSEAAIENYQKIGFVMVMGLVLLTTYNDLSRFWVSMLRTVGGGS